MYHSLLLVRKDFILSKKFMLLFLLYFLSMSFASWETYSTFTIVPPMLLLINSCTLDVHQMNQRFLISLPVRRQELVLAKYMVLIPYSLFGFVSGLMLCLVTALMGNAVNPSFWREIGLTVGTFPLLSAIYLPLYFWLGPKGSRVVNMVFMLVVMLGSTSISTLLPSFPFLTGWLDNVNRNTLLLSMIAGVAYIFMLSCSYAISLRIYKRKDV